MRSNRNAPEAGTSESAGAAVQTSGQAAAAATNPEHVTGSGIGADRSDHIADTKVPPAVLPMDEFHGVGGDFVIGADGVRRRAAGSVPPAAV
jgi:hypothetical protein